MKRPSFDNRSFFTLLLYDFLCKRKGSENLNMMINFCAYCTKEEYNKRK